MTCSSSFWSLSVSDKTIIGFDNKSHFCYNTPIVNQMENGMRPFVFTYLHVPPQFKIAMGLDVVCTKKVTIHANTREEAKKLFDTMMSDI
jgi:hypothetical protein